MKKAVCASMLLIILSAWNLQAQVARTICDGYWFEKEVWENGTIPASGDSIYIDHFVRWDSNFVFNGNFVVVNKQAELCGPFEVSIGAGSEIILNGQMKALEVRVFGTIRLSGFLYTPQLFNQGSVITSTGNVIFSYQDCSPFENPCQVTSSEAHHTMRPFIFPNPSTGTFNLSNLGAIRDDAVMSITNSMGQLVGSLDDQAWGTGMIDLTFLPAGSYHLSIISTSGNYSYTLIKLEP